MTLIPGIAGQKNPIIGEELDGKNFTLELGQVTLKPIVLVPPVDPSVPGSQTTIAVGEGTPVSLPASHDFLRSNNGANTPTSVDDYSVPVTHNGFLGISQTLDPISPLQFGNPVRNDVIRMYSEAPNPHQFFGIGVNPGSLRNQVPSLANKFTWDAGVDGDASKQFMMIDDLGLIIGDKTIPIGIGHWALTKNGNGGSLSFRSPDSAPSVDPLKKQFELFCPAYSGNQGISGGGVEIKTASGTINSVLIPRICISRYGDTTISDPDVPYSSDVATTAVLTVNGCVRVRSGAISGGAPTSRQQNGIVFGAGIENGCIETGANTNGGITSLGQDDISFYTAGAANFRFVGTNAYKQGAGGWDALSDRRVKQNIESVANPRKGLLDLNVVSYEYNGKGGSKKDGVKRLGFIAQELKESGFSHWVSNSPFELESDTKDKPKNKTKDKEDPVLSVNTSELVFELLLQIQQQQKQIDTMKADIAKMRSI